MQTIILNIKKDFQKNIEIASEMLKKGEVIVFPTETVYGMGADIFNVNACKKIFEIKNREEAKPLAAHISNLNMVDMLCESIPDEFFILADAFLPGPLSIILKKRKEIKNYPETETIAIRFPKNDTALSLIGKFGRPIAATSVNISGEKSLNSTDEIYNLFNGKIAAIIDDGLPTYSLESTVISLCVSSPKILRKGVISIEEIEDVLRRKVCF
ncbi:MAG TPA: L-threonylcarbamoyladenylate synthase [Candidatus Kapabacteria bacterium]|nr:L-threonylcarbamoyladenylate synthase [Candidatus Kapabacteria bacterium]